MNLEQYLPVILFILVGAVVGIAPQLLGALLGPTQAAFWRIGKQVADGMAKPARLMVPALYPELAKMRASGGQQAMTKLAIQIALIGGAAAGVLLLASLFAGRWILETIMGPAFGAAAVLGVGGYVVGARPTYAGARVEATLIGGDGGAVWRALARPARGDGLSGDWRTTVASKSKLPWPDQSSASVRYSRWPRLTSAASSSYSSRL